MNQYLSMVADYIDRPSTDYALLINGEWGSGKTHFIDAVVHPYLIEKNIRLIYISLNGTTSTEEISKQIYFETSFLSNGNIKKIRETSLAKQMNQYIKITHNVTSIFGFTNTSNNIIDYEELINMKENTVLCFDDLERCEINIIELLGYINRFVEQDQIKTLIIGNEQEMKDMNVDRNKELKTLTAVISLAASRELKKDIDIQTESSSLFFEQKTYDIIKEKLIGKTILYSPDLQTVIKEIVEEYNDKEVEYYEFLKSKFDSILWVLEKSKRKNIRILKRSLDDFKRVFHVLIKLDETSDDNKVLYQYFIPSLIIGIEYRSDLQKKEILSSLATQRLLPSSFILNGNPITTLFADYLKGFHEPYEFYVSRTVSQYIISNLLNEKELVKEAKIISNKHANEAKNNDFNTLFEITDNFLDLENDFFMNYIQDVEDKLKKGVYPLEYLPRIFYQFHLFNEYALLSMTDQEIEEIFLEGISNSSKSEKETDRYQMWQLEDFSFKYEIIRSKVNKKIYQLESKKLKSELDSTINLLPDNVNEFTEKYYNLVKKKKGHKALLQYIDITYFFDKLIRLSNKDLGKIRQLYSSIYSFSSTSDDYKKDLPHLEKLIELLKDQSQKISGITLLQFELLIEELEEKVEVLKKTTD